MASKIKHDREIEFEYGHVDHLTPNVRRVICKNPGPFTFTGTATFLVGTGKVAVIDPGPELDAHRDAILGALAPGEEISHILITHTHSDHSPGAKAMKEATGAPTYGFGPHGAVSEIDPDDKVDFSKYISDEERVSYEKEYEDLDPALKHEGPDLDFVPDERVEDGDIIRGDGWTFEAIHTPGHCSNHLAFAYAEEDSIFSGDHVMAWATSVVGPPDGSMAHYLASLRKMLPRTESTYWPTHGPAVADPIPYVSSFIEHREGREEQILGYLSDGPKQIADFVPEMYEGYDKRLWYPAASSVLAHILHLVETGRLDVEGGGDPKLTATYRLPNT